MLIDNLIGSIFAADDVLVELCFAPFSKCSCISVVAGSICSFFDRDKL
jgi:hypothetical protein